MVEVHTGLGNNQFGLLIVEVHHTGLGSIQTAAAHAHTATKASATAATHTLVVGIVGIQHTHNAIVITHIHTKQTTRVAVLSTNTQIDIDHRTTVHTCTDTEVEHRLLVTVINTGDTSQVALLVIRANLFNNRSRQVFQCRLSVTEILTINLDLRHLLTIDGDVTVLIDISTRHTLHQFLHHGALWNTISIGIEDQGVTLRLHLGQVSRHCSTLQHDGIRRQTNSTCRYTFTIGYGNLLRVGLEAHIGNTQCEGTITRRLHTEITISISYGIRYYFFTTQQRGCSLNYSILSVLFYYFTGYGPLSKSSDCRCADNHQNK